jgi:enoyl-CoA hydratase
VAESPPLTVTVEGGVATVTMRRPAQRNALDVALLTGLWDALTGLDADPAVAAVVLTGEDPAFCAGVDLKEVGENGGVLAPGFSLPSRGILPEVGVPLIGAVNGAAATGGLEVALSCDFLIASERARFADTHGRIGVMPSGGASVRLPRWIGVARAKQMSATGAFVDAATALRWGLVNEVVAHDALLPRCQEVAADIAANDPAAVRRLLRSYDEGAGATEEDAWDIERSVSRQWYGAGLDLSAVAARRQQIIDRNRRAGH